MAYGLKYTQYIEKGGAQVQIKVYEKDWAGASYGMAHVTGLSLQIIGGQSNILSPLLKTSLSFSLVDAYDQGTTQADGTACVNAQNEKCGRWEEFFTPDATKYKVELISKPSPSASASVIWTGFITPDSWSENMIYRGSVTITARDMLGALQDKEFDLTGRVSVRDVVTGALSACECPMALQLTEAHFLVNSNGHSILDHTFAASTFSGDTWAQALEKTLDSLGLVLRYNGANKVVLTSLRYLAADTTLGAHGIEFINRSGLRQLDPALKSITETFDVDILRVDATDPETAQFTATGSNLTQKIVTHLSSGATQTSTNYIPAYTLAQVGGEGWSGSLAVPQLGTPTDDIAVRKMYIPTDIEESVEATYYNPRLRGAFVFKLTQDGPLAWLTGSAGALKLSHYWGGDGVEEIRVRVEAVVDGVRKYLSGGGDWTTSADSFVISVGQEVSVPDSGAVGISIVIVKVKAATHLPAYYAVFAALNLSVSPASEGTALISEWKTTTNYDQANNVTIKRDPVVGSAGVGGCVDFYGNVLAYGDTIAPDEWNWSGASGDYPLAVMIQAQVLCFHAAAASIFTGTAHDKATPEAAALPGYRIGYYDRVGVLLSGTYDFCSGFVAQTIAREFYTWEEVWGTFDPDYTAISGAGKGSTSATGAGGSSASGGSSGGGGGASVNYFEPDEDVEGAVALKAAYVALSAPDFLIGPDRESLAADLEIIGSALQSLQAQIDAVASRSSFDELCATTLAADLVAASRVYAERYYFTDDIYFYIDVVNGIPCVHLNADFITDGDQILGDGTPGGGGGGGVTYFSELQDVSNAIAGMSSSQLANKMLIWDTGATPVGGESATGAWSVIDKSSVGITTDATHAAHGLMSAADKTKLDSIDTTDIAHGETAYQALDVIGPALQSLQAQIDSVATRSNFDELTATAVAADIVAASDIYGALHGNADTASDADKLDGHDSSYFGTASAVSTLQGYFTNGVANNADKLDGNDSSHFATASAVSTLQGYFTNGVANNADKLDGIHAVDLFTAMTSGAATNLSITIGGTTKTATIYATYDSASENIADKFGIVSSALQALQGQIDAVASRSDISDYEATTEAKMDYICDLMRSLQAQADSIATRVQDMSANGYFDMLSVGGDIYCDYLYSTGDQTLSDERHKKITREIVLTADEIASCRAVAFDWTDRPGGSFGTIAQDWEKILPESVEDHGDTLYLAYKSSTMVGLINLAREVVRLRKEVEQLRKS